MRYSLILLIALGCGRSPDLGAKPGPSGDIGTPTTTSPPIESCDGLDNDGDGSIVEGLLNTYYIDADGDGAGDPTLSVEACEQPEGTARAGDDCDDTDELKWDNSPEGCDGVDNDCDGLVDEDHRVGWDLVTVHHDGTVYNLNMNTGVPSRRALLFGVENFDDINSTDTLDANVVMVHNLQGILPNQIQRLDACTGELTSVGNVAVTNMPGIAFGPKQRLYGLDNGPDTLIEIDTTNASSTTVMDLGADLLRTGMAYDCSEEKLWVADMENSQVFWLDPIAQTSGGHVPITVPFSSVGLEFDNTTRTLIASTGSELWRIDPLTGGSTFIVTLQGMERVTDLAFFPPCP
ncbi:MAG: hypothetical protein GWP91_19075 [Rhodobacterales bacterium]|nr:hypothetical protein [Rhodobacterales bacterium]